MLQYFGHLMQRANSLEKDPDAGKDWRQEEKGAAEDEMGKKHHQLNGHESENTEGPRSLACYSSEGHKESDTISNWTTINQSRDWVSP